MKWTAWVAMALLAPVLGQAAEAAEPQFDWVVIAPKPGFNPGFLLIPDDSEAGPVFQCTPASCGPAPVACTSRVFPRKPEAWHGWTTREWFADPERSVGLVFAFAQDDAERLAQALSMPLDQQLSMERIQDTFSWLPGRLVQARGRDMILLPLPFLHTPAGTIHAAAWMDGNEPHRTVCLVADGAPSAAMPEFAARP